ncbi:MULTISPECIES: hypothetical protein [Deinococcus]|uniref:Terminase large subunit gp17-like C-terminal domain-containing protein n=1 Tax=Deinococcus rufus TaxID=2136097 RepID=A0ABV7Z7R3_9DEIO|nr:hypothetical protein [Deinococcus sp. AB2017081]WQE94423.1 hypothetical protein U2P90_13540 [Deinococcus sp. AB2017081]
MKKELNTADQLKIIRDAGERDFEFFQRQILQIPEEFIRPHQLGWVDSFETYTKVMLLAPREHLKSSTLTAYLLWKVLYNPELRILIVTISDSLASGMLNRVKTILETNPRIKKLFGDVKGNGIWGAEGLTLKRKNVYTEPTIKAIGVGTAAVGSRCDLLICDDLTDSQKADSPAERLKLSERFFGELSSLVFAGGRTIVLGTRKSKDDLYSEILGNKSFYSIVQSAIQSHSLEELEYEYIRDANDVIVDVAIKTEAVEVLDPIRWPLQRLLLRRAETGSTLFLREYQNDISSFKGAFLKPEWLRLAEEIPPWKELNIYMGVDLAISEKQTADFTVITSIGHHRKTNRIYLLRMHRGRHDFPTTLENIQGEFNYWKDKGVRPLKITVESNAAQKATYQMLFKTSNLPVIPSHTSKGKESRMTLLAPYFENKRITLSPDFDPEGVFKTEWSAFPNARVHDDSLDAVEIALRPILSGGKSGQVVIGGIR